jgi:adhesin HecA-like repeat protein
VVVESVVVGSVVVVSVVVTGGAVVVTGGSVVVTGGSVVVTGGSVVVTGGSVVVTGGSVVVTGGSVVVTGGVVVGHGAVVPAGGVVVIGDVVPTVGEPGVVGVPARGVGLVVLLGPAATTSVKERPELKPLARRPSSPRELEGSGATLGRPGRAATTIGESSSAVLTSGGLAEPRSPRESSPCVVK